jgi:hypothetical protein
MAYQAFLKAEGGPTYAVKTFTDHINWLFQFVNKMKI